MKREGNDFIKGKGEMVFNILLEAGYVLALVLLASTLYTSFI
jgi:hypothetical protein